MKLLTALAMLLLSTSSFAATISSMSKSEVMDVLSDKTLTTISAATLNGKVLPNSFTGYFGKNGKMNGGFANQVEGAPQTDNGTWQVKNDGSVCMTWEHWFDGKEECVHFFKLSNGLLVIGSNHTFESLVLNSDIKSGNQMQ